MTDTIRATDGPVHSHFGLTYANYLVIPRTLLQSMPEKWQQQFVELLDELHVAFAHVAQAETYDVRAGWEYQVRDLDDAQLVRAGITKTQYLDTDPEFEGEARYVDRDGEDKTHRPPAGWRHLLVVEAARIGWASAYGTGR